MKIDKTKVVTMTYELSVYGQDESLSVLESRDKKNPIEFVFGRGLVLPSLEKDLEGKIAGYKNELILFPKNAFGEFKPELEQWLDIDKFPKDVELRVGMKFQTQGLDHEVIPVMVKKIEDDQVLLDGNHPLAGLKIKFTIEVLRLREATEDELLSGEVKMVMH